MTIKPENVTAVNEWPSANCLNATVLSPFGDWMGFETTVSHAKELLDAEFPTFVHDGSRKSVIRAFTYSIPTSLRTTSMSRYCLPTITWVICSTPFQDSSFPCPKDIGLPIFSSYAKIVPAGNMTSAVALSSCRDDAGVHPTKHPIAIWHPQLAVSVFLHEFTNSKRRTQGMCQSE